MSVDVAKTRQKLILEHFQRLKREVALHPSASVRMLAAKPLREIERLLET